MNKELFKKASPHLVAIVIFVVVTIIYFNPLLEGKKIEQGDIKNHQGVSKEIFDYREKTGDEALWTNSVFGGMPAYQISTKYKNDLKRSLIKLYQLGLPHPAQFLFLYMIGFYILLVALRSNPWLSVAGAMAFAFSTYFLIILAAGHNSKAHAIAYMAPVIAGFLLTFRGKYLLGGILFCLFLTFEIAANHLQITYYLLIVILIIGLYELAKAIKQNQLNTFYKAIGISIIAVIIAIASNFGNIYLTQDHVKYTTRGGSNLSTNTDDQTSGLGKSYATAWSYGIQETFTLLIPNAKGGATGYLKANSSALQKADAQYRSTVGSFDHYWGDQPFTSGPVYVGAFVFFLFFLGLFILQGRFKWYLFGAIILSVMLAWGNNYMGLTEFFMDYIPGYNKFRTVSMTLVIAELCIPLIAFLALDQFLKNPETFKMKFKKILIPLAIVEGFLLLFYLFPDGFFNFIKEDEYGYFNEFLKNGATAVQVNDFKANLVDVRVYIFKSDVIRSFFIILAGVGLMMLYAFGKMKKNLFIPAVIVLILIDLFPINKRYLNNDNFVRKSKVEKPFQLSNADQSILKDTDPDYRVLNLSVNIFNDASTSYFHKSIGGYHGAKLQRYQELISHHLEFEIQKLQQAFTETATQASIQNTLAGLPVINMLNTKYVIVNPNAAAIQNQSNFGHAWFVEDVIYVENSDEEIQLLKEVDPKLTAIVDVEFKDLIASEKYGNTPGANIQLSEYQPNYLNYTSDSKTEQLAIFSEIYYENGWNAYLNGEKTPHFRVNYTLRGMIIPPGKNTIEFRFEPEAYYRSSAVMLAGSILLILAMLGYIAIEYSKRRVLKNG